MKLTPFVDNELIRNSFNAVDTQATTGAVKQDGQKGRTASTDGLAAPRYVPPHARKTQEDEDLDSTDSSDEDQDSVDSDGDVDEAVSERAAVSDQIESHIKTTKQSKASGFHPFGLVTGSGLVSALGSLLSASSQALHVRNKQAATKNNAMDIGQLVTRKSAYVAPNPLMVPEILSLVFSFLSTTINTGTNPTQPLDFIKVDSVKYSLTRPKLAACTAVCKLWYQCASPLLWKSIKVGSLISCLRLESVLAEEIPLQDSRMMAKSFNNSLLPMFHRSNHQAVQKSNSKILGKRIQAFTILSPHNTSSPPFEQWNLNGVVRALSDVCSNLQELNLSNCSQVSDKSMVSLVSRCHKLQRVNLNRCDMVSSATIYAMAQMFATTRSALRNPGLGLTVLNLSRPLISQKSVIDDASVRALLKYAPNLQELRLRNCDLVRDDTIILMSKTCGKSLLALDLRYFFIVKHY